MPDVIIDGTIPDQVVDVQTARRGESDLGAATVRMVATPANRSIEAGDDVRIQRPGSTWSGSVTAKRLEADSTLLAVDAIETRLSLKHQDLSQSQVFYDIPSSRAVELAATTQAQPLSKTPIHVGSDTADWSSTAPVFERYAGTRAGLYQWGTDLLFLGARQGYSQPVTATYEAVPQAAIADGIRGLDTRLLVNDPGNVWSVEIELVTPGGTTYVWEPELSGSGFQALELAAEEATPNGELSGTGQLQYRFYPNATLANDTGIFIDNAHTLPFRRRSRPTTLDTAGVQATQRQIIRRPARSAAQFIQDLAIEDQYTWYVDQSDTLFYVPASQGTRLSITAGSTPVTGVDADRDYEGVRNVVSVQGAGDIEVTVRDVASIQYYGSVPRSEPIVDKTLQSEQAARARGEGYLNDRAWNDAQVTFTIADEAYDELTAASKVPVDWPTPQLSGSFEVDRVVASNGLVEVTILASSASN